MSKEEHNRPLSNEVKRHFLEIVSTYTKYQEMIERKSDIAEVCETLGGIIEAARELALRESDDWFDAHTVKRNMSELDKLQKQFDKLALDAKNIDQRLVGLYEDMGHILSRYYKFGDISEDEMKKRLAIRESVKKKMNEANMPGEFVAYVITDKGRYNYVTTLKSGQAAKVWQSKNRNLMSKSGIRGIGVMNKQEWDRDWAKYSEAVNEAIAKLKKPLELGQGKKGVYYLHGIGHDTNGNWSYMVSRGANKPKKIQHQGQWREKLTKNHSDEDVFNSDTAAEIIKYYEKFTNESIVTEGAMKELEMMAKEASTFRQFTKDVWKEFDHLPQNKESVKWLEKVWQDVHSNEAINEAPLGMDMSARKKVYDKLNKGDKVRIIYGTSISGGNENVFVVTKGKTIVGKQRVERITLANTKNPSGVKYYLYNRDGNIGMAVGDMGAVIKKMEPVNESINEAKNITVITYGGRKNKYTNDDIDEFLADIEMYLSADNLPGWLYRTAVEFPAILGNEYAKLKSRGKLKQGIIELLKKIKAHPGKVTVDVDSKKMGYERKVIFESTNESINEGISDIISNIGLYGGLAYLVIWVVAGKYGIDLSTPQSIMKTAKTFWKSYKLNRRINKLVGKEMKPTIERLLKDPEVIEFLKKSKGTGWRKFIESKIEPGELSKLGSILRSRNLLQTIHYHNTYDESVNESLEVGDKLTHKHNKDIEIELVATTNRGWKVKQTEPKGPRSKKTTTQYYDSQDLSGPKALFEAAHGYTDSTAGYVSKHNDEYKMAEKINKSVKGDEMAFYDELEKVHEKLKHAKYMIWLANALRGYKVDMYKDPKIRNKAEAEEALYLLSK